MKVLMLAPWMKMGHGVSEMIGCLAPELANLGIGTTVGCLDHDQRFAGVDLRRVQPNPVDVGRLAAECGAGAVVALGSPFFEVLPHLDPHLRTIVYEAGDPTPELFESDAAERRTIVEFKRAHVYPHVDAVAAISDFIRSDIGYEDAVVLRLGVDNIPDLGNKPWSPPRPPGPIRVGVLARLGAGEARYKGFDEFLQLAAALEELEVPASLEVMGRGTGADALLFEERGLTVHLNASDAERNAFLRGLDVFVSTSLWEGTNLPLVEAQALGTPGLAFDTGAHPEFTPLLFSDVHSMALQCRAYASGSDRALLAEHGRMCRRFVRSTMRWSETAAGLAALIEGRDVTPVPRATSGFPAQPGLVRRVVGHVRAEGWRATAAKARGRLLTRPMRG